MLLPRPNFFGGGCCLFQPGEYRTMNRSVNRGVVYCALALASVVFGCEVEEKPATVPVKVALADELVGKIKVEVLVKDGYDWKAHITNVSLSPWPRSRFSCTPITLDGVKLGNCVITDHIPLAPGEKGIFNISIGLTSPADVSVININ